MASGALTGGTSGGSRIRGWPRGPGGQILLLGAIALVLQQIPVPYTVNLFDRTANASLAHLQTAFLQAVAMLSRDRRVPIGVGVVLYLGWAVRAWSSGYDLAVWLPVGALSQALRLVWLLACVWMMGWPRPPARERVEKSDLARFGLVGLLLFPLGSTVTALMAGFSLSVADNMFAAIQTLFARYFGVAVLTFPLVMAWCERDTPPPSPLRWWHAAWPLMLCGLLVVTAAASQGALQGIAVTGSDRIALMDYRFAMFALLGWCALRLRIRTSMVLLVLTLLALVYSMVEPATRSGTPLGFANLVYLAFELAVLLMAILYFLVYARDRRELATRLEAEARRDPATDLPNLAAFRHDTRGARALPGAGEVGFLLLGRSEELIVGFGLDIQAQVAAAVAARLSGGYQVYLVGAGQFALLPAADGDGGADDRWQRVLDSIDTVGVDSVGQHIGLSPYLGVARWSGSASGAVESALSLASELAFEARRRHEVRPLRDDGATALPAVAMRTQVLAAADAMARIRGGGIELHFQPIRPLDPAHPGNTAPDCAFGEVLCRLRREDGRLLMPSDFLEPVEAAGRMVELDLAVLRALFEELGRYPQTLPMVQRIAVNLSGQSLASSNFRQQLELLLAQSPLPLSALCFEITENAVISREANTRELLEGIRRRGCSIAIDDFGKGMQSFARLKQVPVDIIKIDGSFVLDCAERGRDYALIDASVSIARAFGATTVAEYVETEAIADCLRELEVDWMQGYLYSRPRPLAQVLEEAVVGPG